MKERFKPGTMIYPVPAAMISCGKTEDEHNIFTASWVGTTCTNPPMCYVSIRPERHSHGIISRNGEFVINLTTQELAKATDWCGVKSGRDHNKFEELKLTKGKTQVIDTVYIEESPLCIECRVKQIIKLGSHDMFLADVVNVLADKKYIDPQTGTFHLSESNLIAYSHGNYYKLGEQIGKFGWSVEKKIKSSQVKQKHDHRRG